MDDTPRTLTTVETTIEIIRALQRQDGSTVTELARELDLSKGAVYNHLATLRQQRLVVQEDNVYRLGLRFKALGAYVQQNTPLYRAGKDETDRLANETGEYVHLMAEEYGRGIHVYKTRGEKAVDDRYYKLDLERPEHLHYSAIGKSVLAHLPEEKVERIIDERGLPKRTENTITDREALFDELETIREQGYAHNDQEETPGLRAVGAPIKNSGGDVLGAISITAPLSRLQGDRFDTDFPETVVQTANVIELNLETPALK